MSTFLRVTGILKPTGQFEPQTGWETPRIARPVTPSGRYRVDLLDAEHRVLARTRMASEEPGCGRVGDQVWLRLTGYVAYDGRGRHLRIADGDDVIYETSVATHAPAIEVLTPDIAGDRLRLAWRSTSEHPVAHKVAAVIDRRRAFVLADDTAETSLEVDLARLPAGRGRFVVMVSDGLRSASAATQELDFPGGPPCVSVLEPTNGAVVSPLQPFNVIGSATDAGGEPLADDHLRWTVDGHLVSRGRRLAGVEPLQPGPHQIELIYEAPGSRRITSAVVDVTVREPTAEERAWVAGCRRWTTSTGAAPRSI